jgi:hypothetical protein
VYHAAHHERENELTTKLESKFAVGQCAATPGALEAILKTGEAPIQFLARHMRGDWGDLCDNDKAANDAALIPNEDGEGDRILSAYHLRDQTKIYVITEWDRSRTTVLLPDEY